MRKAVLTLLAAFALVAGVLAQPGTAAAKPTYKVSIATNVAKSSAGAFIKVAGKVTGPKAGGKAVLVQRRYADTGWSTVAVATTTKKGRYAARVETPRGGNTSFRVVKAGSKAAKAGVSATRTLPVYEWLYLANEGYFLNSGFVNTPVDDQIGSSQFSRSMTFNDGDTTISYNLGSLCTSFTTLAYYRTPGVGLPDDMSVGVERSVPIGPPSVKNTSVTTGTTKTITSSLVGTPSLTLHLTSLDASYYMTLGNPRVLCNADHLPSVSTI